jgi:putative membrane-bound dehydrogenase-like protein
MTVPDGFSVELVAAEPDIVNPVAMTFDERGRIWITESLEYPRKQAGPGQDRVKILEDTDGDGKADKFSIFAEGLNIPSGIAVGHGGVWVANSPDILFYPDADRDGKPDGKPQTVVTGFGRFDTHELPNSLTWGPDGYLYGLNGVFNQSNVKYAKENPNYKDDHPGWQFTCAMFRIHPVTREFEIFCEGTSNPWGLAFDHEGSAFVSACVIDHLWHLVRTGYYHRQGGPYPPFTWKIDSIVKHTHQKAAYAGLCYYDSDAYPEQYRNKLYMGNIHGGCINVDKLQRDGSTYFATGEPDFLTANDAWFMPVAQKTGPDGCLYILDWYDRYHCYQDANRDSPGIDRLKGRLYRVRYAPSLPLPMGEGRGEGAKLATRFDLAAETDDQLFDRLNSNNGYFRDTALRMLLERRALRNFSPEDSLVSKAILLTFNDKLPTHTRIHAASVAYALSPPQLAVVALQTMIDWKDSFLRAWGRRLVSNQRAGGLLLEQIKSRVNEQSPNVMLETVVAVGSSSKNEGKIPTLVHVLANCGDDKLIPHVVWQNLHPLLEDHADEFISSVRMANTHKSTTKPLVDVIPRAIERLLASKKSNAKQIGELFSAVPIESSHGCTELLAARIQSGELRGEQLNRIRDAISQRLAEIIDAVPNSRDGVYAVSLAASWGDATGREIARKLASDASQGPITRMRAITALIAGGDKSALDLATAALSEKNNSELAGQVIAALGRLESPRVSTAVLEVYTSLAAEIQPKAIELLTQRAIWAKPLVETIGANKIPATALNVNQIQRLLALKDKELTAAVNKHWGTIRTSRDPAREQLVGEMRKLIRTTNGDAHRGIEVFNRVCGQCHKIYGQGQEVGPDITVNGRASVEQLLSNVFDPSLVIGAAYQARIVQAADGRIITGLLTEDSPQRVVLKVQGGKLETIARDSIEAMKTSELSLMPEGLEKQLKPQEIADLFAYITLDKHPDDPTAKPIPSGADGKK